MALAVHRESTIRTPEAQAESPPRLAHPSLVVNQALAVTLSPILAAPEVPAVAERAFLLERLVPVVRMVTMGKLLPEPLVEPGSVPQQESLWWQAARSTPVVVAEGLLPINQVRVALAEAAAAAPTPPNTVLPAARTDLAAVVAAEARSSARALAVDPAS